jgi:hypothetical protein
MNIEDFKRKIDNFYNFLNKDELYRYHYYNILSFERNEIFGFPCPTEVRKSNYGNGLFASRFINKNTILSIYPCHGISVKNEDGLTSTQLTVSEEHNDAIFKNNDYTINIGEPGTDIYGCPSIENNSWLKGHIANDGSYDYKNKDLDVAPFVISLLINDKKNNTDYEFIEHKGINWLVLQANKDILADEEILVNYGEHYWLSRLGKKISKEELENKIKIYLTSKPLRLQYYYKALIKKWNYKK